MALAIRNYVQREAHRKLQLKSINTKGVMKMRDDLISVIIPTYKRNPNMVKRAIQSVLNQSYQTIELIVVDDSPDDFDGRPAVEEMILSLNDNRVKYIQHPKNMGACAARNTGIKNSKGEYLAFLDDDDEWLPLKLEKQIKLMSNPNVGLVYCRQKVVNEEDKTETINMREFHSGKVFDKLIVRNFIGSTSFALIKKECFNECGLFNTKIKAAQDRELYLRIAQKYEVAYIDEVLVVYHIHSGERITSNPYNQLQGIEFINTLYSDYLDKHKKSKSIRLIRTIPVYIKIGDRKKALKKYLQAVKLAPLNFKLNLKYLIYIIVKRPA